MDNAAEDGQQVLGSSAPQLENPLSWRDVPDMDTPRGALPDGARDTGAHQAVNQLTNLGTPGPLAEFDRVASGERSQVLGQFES